MDIEPKNNQPGSIEEPKKEKKPFGVQVVLFLLMLLAGVTLLPIIITGVIGIAFCAIIPACAYFFFSYLKERNHNNCKLKTNKNYCLAQKETKKKKYDLGAGI